MGIETKFVDDDDLPADFGYVEKKKMIEQMAVDGWRYEGRTLSGYVFQRETA